jgi:replication initiation and membrane attachment protein DnaB
MELTAGNISEQVVIEEIFADKSKLDEVINLLVVLVLVAESVIVARATNHQLVVVGDKN